MLSAPQHSNLICSSSRSWSVDWVSGAWCFKVTVGGLLNLLLRAASHLPLFKCLHFVLLVLLSTSALVFTHNPNRAILSGTCLLASLWDLPNHHNKDGLLQTMLQKLTLKCQIMNARNSLLISCFPVTLLKRSAYLSLSIYLSICRSIYLFTIYCFIIYIYVLSSFCLSVAIIRSICLSFYLSIVLLFYFVISSFCLFYLLVWLLYIFCCYLCLSIVLSLCMSFCLFICWSVFLSIDMSFCLSFCFSFCFYHVRPINFQSSRLFEFCQSFQSSLQSWFLQTLYFYWKCMVTVYEFRWILIHVNSTSKYIRTEQLHALQLSTGGLHAWPWYPLCIK